MTLLRYDEDDSFSVVAGKTDGSACDDDAVAYDCIQI